MHERGLQISYEWIYQYIYKDKPSGGNLHLHLRCQKQRRKRDGSYNRHGQLPDRIFIDERPSVGEFLSLIVYLHDLVACDLKVSSIFRKCNQSGK